MPVPREGESRNQFISRCMSDRHEQELRPDQDARLARCIGIWESERDTMSVNQKLLKAVRSRTEKRTEFSYGITTADRYVKTVEECIGHENCGSYACNPDSQRWRDVMSKAAETLVYSNQDMVLGDKLVTSLTGWKETFEIDDTELELPKNTLMVFSHTLTTPRKDRDGDRLRSEGAILDPKMLLLWQHIPTLPIGKLLSVLEQNEKRVRNVSCIVDMNDLCHDAAVMVDNDMGRFSHGFRALLFDQLKEEQIEDFTPNGFDIQKFEVMEESLVSIPSNVDAETEDVILTLVSSGKLTSPLMKTVGKRMKEERPTSVNVTKEIPDEDKSRSRSGEGQGEAGEKQGCTCNPPEEADETSETKETSTDSKVKGNPLPDSYEWVGNKLRQQAKSFLENARVVSLRERFVWVAGTFADHAILCAEHYEYGIDDEFLYYRGSWEMEEGEPRFSGSPDPVEIVTTVEIRERSPLFADKSQTLNSTKVGRTISRRNLAKLSDVKEDLVEIKEGHLSTRAGAAMCERCITKLEEVIGDSEVNSEEEESRQVSVDQAIGVIISNADKDERARLKRYLDALDNENSLVAQFRSFVAGS